MASTSAASAAASAPADLATLLPSLLGSLRSVKLPSSSASPASAASSARHSLLALKPALLHEYTHAFLLLQAHRLRGHSLTDKRGDGLVRSLLRLRLCLEKARPIEARAKSGIDRLLRAAEAAEKKGGPDAADDDEAEDSELAHAQARKSHTGIRPYADCQCPALVSFRPNLAALSASSRLSRPVEAEDDDEANASSGVYRPPRLAPVAYDGERKASSSRTRNNASAGRSQALLADLTTGLSENPHEASSGGVGLGGGIANRSARAAALARVEAYEEANMTRLATSAKDAKKRRREEEAVALGGARGGGAAGLEEEFGGLLNSHVRKRKADDAYDGLRGRRENALVRARTKSEKTGGTFEVPDAPGTKRSTFDKAVKRNKQAARGKR
jgi:U3 small nucleolar ribonucleoprotein protein LCP5